MATNSVQRLPGEPVTKRQPAASATKLAKKTESPNTAKPRMDFLDNLTGYADDIGDLYKNLKDKDDDKPADKAKAKAKTEAATDNSKWIWIGGGVLAVVLLVAMAVLFKK